MIEGETIIVSVSVFDQDEAIGLIQNALAEAGILAEVTKR